MYAGRFFRDEMELPNGRLLISLTAQEGRKNILKSEFASFDELIACLEASCFIPGYSASFRQSGPIVDGRVSVSDH